MSFIIKIRLIKENFMNNLQIYTPVRANEFKDDVNSDGSQNEHLIYFDVRFRMATTLETNSLELAVDKIHAIPERELLNFNERDAAEITICHVF